VGGCAGAVIDDGDFVSPGDDLDGRLGAEDGVAALALAALDGFEEEGGGGALVGGDQASIREDRRELIF
jgi:hypothetical protein